MFANGWHHHDQHCHDHLLHNPYHQSHLLHHHDLLNQDEEQWWTARNSLGQTGSIPVPYVAKVIQHIIDSHHHHLGLGLTTNWCNFQEWLNFFFVRDSRNPVAGWSFHLFEANFSAFSDFVDHCGHPPASPPMSLSFNERSPQYLTQFLHEEAASPTHWKHFCQRCKKPQSMDISEQLSIQENFGGSLFPATLVFHRSPTLSFIPPTQLSARRRIFFSHSPHLHNPHNSQC